MTASAPPADASVPHEVARRSGRASDEPAVASFLERFFRFGAEPGVESYMPLFHRDVTLFDDGMERPIGYDEIPASITATLALAQGFHMVPERWRHRDGVVFVEARNEATILGTPCRWQSVYRVHLDGDRVIDGRRYYDRAPLLATFDPATPRLPSLGPPGQAPEPSSVPPLPCLERGAAPAELVEICARGWSAGDWSALASLFREDATWHAPGLDDAVPRAGVAGYRARFAQLLGGAVPQVSAWAGDDTLLLVEWRADVRASAGGAAYALGMVDRFDLVSGRVLAARTYLDAASLARGLAPAG